ncbi:MAG TPA: hypothetical protein VM327_01935 [Candidatus Thermoplasmatota archaeon]|nr:hypothetical protein [Candidatus Thermoplasmatota archaeon]
MVDPRALSLFLFLALAGCANEPTLPGGPTETEQEAGSEAPVAGSSSGTTTAEPAEPPASGPQPASSSAALPGAAGPVIGTCKLSAVAGAGAGSMGFSGVGIGLCPSVRLSSASGGPFRSAVVEMEWSNDAPTLAEVSLEVSDGSGGLGFGASAQSPVRVELAAGAFEPSPQVDWSAMFDGSGVFAGFQATVTFSLFESAEPPAGYTAL